MAGLRGFLGTDGVLRDEKGNTISITDTDIRNDIAGGVVPVDIGTRPNANDGDPLRTSFSKLNNFVLASYQNDSDVQLRVGALEAGSVFLGLFQAGELPRRVGLRIGGTRPWESAGDRWPVGAIEADLYKELSAESVPDLEANKDATNVLAMISRPIEGSPALSVVIDNIRANINPGTLRVTIAFPSIVTGGLEQSTSSVSPQVPLGGAAGIDSDFPAVRTGVINIGSGINTAEEIAIAIRNALIARETADGADYFTYNIEVPTTDTRRLTIDFNFRAEDGASIPTELITIEQMTALDPKLTSSDLTSNGNTRGEGILALPWIDQDLDPNVTIPAYTIFEWTMDGWSVADQGRGDINAEFLFFDDERTTTAVAISTDFTDATGGNVTDAKPEDVTTPSTKEIDPDGTRANTRDAITDVQQFGIDYIHSVTIDAGEY